MADSTVSSNIVSIGSQEALNEILRQGAQQMLAQAVENEVAEYLVRHTDQRDEDGRRLVVRNGYLPIRNLQTGVGLVEVRQEKARADAARKGLMRARQYADPFSTTALCKWQRCQLQIARAELSINPPEQHNVSPEGPATYTLSLTNAGESQESREYILRTVHTSNPSGAVLSANGSPLHAGLSFFIGPQQG